MGSLVGYTSLMLPITLGNPTKCLFLGAHSDDIEIGCGGTLLRLLETYPDLEVRWVVFTSNEVRANEARASARSFSPNIDLELHTFRNGYFPQESALIKDAFEGLKPFNPDIVFTHYRQDLHQDHRTVSELTWNTFRNHTVLEYEILKFDGDLGNPNLFVALEPEHLARKIEILQTCFPSQQDKQWFSSDTFSSMARIRGVHGAVPSGNAEAFYAQKLAV